MLNKTCDIKININSYISQQLSHGHNQMHLRNNACYVMVKMFIILIIILIIHNLCIIFNISKCDEIQRIKYMYVIQNRKMFITGTHHIYSVWFDCRKKKYRPQFHTTLLDVKKTH